MNTRELLNKVQLKLEDGSYTRRNLLERMNSGLVYVAGHIPLPKLQVSSEVDTVLDQDFVALPETFQHNLFSVYNASKSWKCTILYSRRTLEELYDHPDEEGPVKNVVDEGDVLYYRRIPKEAETLKLKFNAFPAALLDQADSVPVCLPKGLHEHILVNYVLADVFSEIEDGIDGAKTNTDFYWNEFLNAYSSLEGFYPGVARAKRHIPRRISFF